MVQLISNHQKYFKFLFNHFVNNNLSNYKSLCIFSEIISLTIIDLY